MAMNYILLKRIVSAMMVALLGLAVEGPEWKGSSMLLTMSFCICHHCQHVVVFLMWPALVGGHAFMDAAVIA